MATSGFCWWTSSTAAYPLVAVMTSATPSRSRVALLSTGCLSSRTSTSGGLSGPRVCAWAADCIGNTDNTLSTKSSCWNGLTM